jgi:hypothetical protein
LSVPLGLLVHQEPLEEVGNMVILTGKRVESAVRPPYAAGSDFADIVRARRVADYVKRMLVQATAGSLSGRWR